MLLPFEMSSDLSEEAKLVDEIRNIGLKDEGRLTYAEMLMAFRRSQDRVLKMAHMNISTVNIKQMGLKGHVPNLTFFESKMEALRVDRGMSGLHFGQKKN